MLAAWAGSLPGSAAASWMVAGRLGRERYVLGRVGSALGTGFANSSCRLPVWPVIQPGKARWVEHAEGMCVKGCA
eukprot:2591091-Prymnesium_polylepis.3